MHPEDRIPLRGVARSLDGLFAELQSGRSLDDLFNLVQHAPPTPLPAAWSAPRESPPAGPGEATDGRPESSFPSPELTMDAAAAVAEASPVDPAEDRRVRIVGAADALADAVDALLRDSGRPETLAQRIRDAAAVLREEHVLEPLVNATERLAGAAPVAGPSLARDLARHLTTPAVSAGLALRLAAATDEPRRDELIDAYRRLDEEAAVALAAALAVADDRAARRNLVDGLVAMGEEGLRQAEQMVRGNNDWGVVRNGVAILGELGGERAVAQLMDTLEHHRPQVRRESVAALERIGGEGAVLLIIERLEDADEGVRAAAARALGNLGSARIVKTLLSHLEREHSDDVLQELLRALGQLGDPGAVPAIEKRAVVTFLRRPHPPVRLAAYQALALIGTPHAKQLVEDATHDKDPEVRALARSLIGRG